MPLTIVLSLTHDPDGGGGGDVRRGGDDDGGGGDEGEAVLFIRFA